VSLARLTTARRLSIHGNERSFALMGAVTIAFSSILVRLSHASPSTAAIFRCAYALPILGALAWREDRRFGSRPWRERRAGLAAGVFFAVDILLWNHSIADVGAGLATVLANIQVVLVPLVAWALLAEAPGRQILLALPVALTGVLLISGVLEHGAYGVDPTRGTLFGLGAGIAYVGFLLLLRHGGSDLRRPAGPLFDATAVSTVLCLIAGLVIGDARLVPSWPSAVWLLLLALSSQVMGWLLITASLPRLPAAMTSMLLTVQPIGSVALAALIFGESPSSVQLAGVVLVLVALVAAGRSRRSPAPAEELLSSRRLSHEAVPPSGPSDRPGRPDERSGGLPASSASA
jgi:drug/metabolite transporter (DMT)-like permease